MTPEHSAGVAEGLQSCIWRRCGAQYEAVARQATAETWSYEDYLLELVQRECQQRQHKRIERLLKRRSCRWRRAGRRWT